MPNECGAKTRAGGKCKAPAMANGRCRVHGGTSTGPKNSFGNQNARKHGIYSDSLTDEEQSIWDEIGVGTLDDDIKIAKLQLRRALVAQAKAEDGDGLELEVDTDSSGPAGSTITRQRKRRGYEDIINRLLGRIGDLEAKRADIMKKLEGDDEGPPPQRVEVVVTDARRPEA
ncbi:hypothetical protein EAW52_10835 [Pseudomonas sp. LTJR-52]|uniref:HGGxSTG domain-containing protein n=1 Tax=Pseudomonas sp. LTJR-52 TaxID=2479392 RepID=UPI000EFAF17E|nr:HGGxSTG domain-containing protein [Pseudomonas sp. LTJR-52]AYN94419.1 hypothetical protein EAW52_10835 [Pseudomonas sp. LTJR-52]